jgi:hypothetical protein
MANVTLSAPSIEVNDRAVMIVPNSLSYNTGEGETTVRAGVVGGSAKSVHSVNAESKISMVKFKMFVVDTTDELIAEWKENIGSNFVALSQMAGGENIRKAFNNMSMVNNPDREANESGEVEIEFKGDAAI